MKQSKVISSGALTNDVRDALLASYQMSAVPKLTVDWNLNRYVTPTADNIPSEQLEGVDIESFPASSIIEPLRPTKGVIKAMVGQAVAGSTYQQPDDTKFYIGSPDDVYKYWISPEPTDASGNFALHDDGETKVRPHVLYPEVQRANKIVIKVENTWATPNACDVLIRTTVGAALPMADWTVVALDPAIDPVTGEIILYFDGTNWVSTKPANPVRTDVAGIMFRVHSMEGGVNKGGNQTVYQTRATVGGRPTGQMIESVTDGTNSSMSLIAIEAHFETDMTNRLISVNDNFEMSEVSQLYPIGTITTNLADIELSNEDGEFNSNNPFSEYKGLIESNAIFNLEYIYDIDGVKHSVQQFKMYGGVWRGQSSDSVQIELEDASKFLKETKPLASLYEGKPATELIWRILDSVGFVDYEIQEEDSVIEHIIPFFWLDGVKTVWEVLDEIANATQTAIYFDNNGKLQVRTRSAAFRDTATTDWTIRGQKDGSVLPDIAELSFDENLEANKVDVKYRTTKWKVGQDGKPALSKVWEPDSDSVVVRSSPLTHHIRDGSLYVMVNQKDALSWPYSGKVSVEGEIISYEGKHYVYYTGVGATDRNVAIVHSIDEQKKLDAKTMNPFKYKNSYSGGLRIKERAVWNTEEREHLVDARGWAPKAVYYNTNLDQFRSFSPNGMRYISQESKLNINTTRPINSIQDIFYAIRSTGGVPETPYVMYGMKIKFNKDAGSRGQRGGLAFCLHENDEQGYHVEVTPSSKLTAAIRKDRNEVGIISHKGGGVFRRIARGTPIAVAEDVWYELDIYVYRGVFQDRIAVWLNGQMVAEGTTTDSTKHPAEGRFGIFTKGPSNIDVEYVYAVSRYVVEPEDDFGFYDLKYGGVRSGYWLREHVYQLKTRWRRIYRRRWVKETYRHNQYLFDEFGPYVHEIREFDVKFDPNPSQYSTLFSTNDYGASAIEYTSTPFGAKFTIANTSRDNAILHGEDSLTFGSPDRVINHVLTVLGRNLEVADDETVTKRNEEAIRSRGVIEIELASDWIQTKAMADSLAEWITKHWSTGLDTVNVELFGNPLIEIGDVLAVDYDRLDLQPETHKYFVTGVRNTFDAGISTELTLRRINTATAIS